MNRKVVVFHAARAGAGKTHITANTAAWLALKGKRVGIVELDFAAPGLYILFGLSLPKSAITLNHFVWHEASLADVTQTVTSRLITEASAAGRDLTLPETTSVLLAPASPDIDIIRRLWEIGFDLSQIQAGLSQMVRFYNLDYLLVDTLPGFSQSNLLTAVLAELLFIVTTPDEQHIASTLGLMDAITRIDEPPMALITNLILPETARAHETGQLSDIAAQFYLPTSRQLAALHSRGLLTVRQPEADWSRAIARIGQHILDTIK